MKRRNLSVDVACVVLSLGLGACGGVDGASPNADEPASIERQDPLEEGLRYDDLPDVGEFVVDGREWGTTSLTYFFQNGTSDISGSGEEGAFRDAIQLWEEQSPLTFTEVFSAGSADIVVLFGTGDHGDGFDFDGTNGVLAHAFYPPPNGGSLAGDAHFDDDETWTTATQGSSSQPIDLVTVAAHELGHSLGLAHSSTTGALMNAFYVGSQRFLGVDDMAGIQSIYGTDTTAETNDNYGHAVAMGDFNNDGFSDLAIGVPGQAVSGDADAGLVYVQYGSASGSLALQTISQDSYEIGGGAEAGDLFGSALAAGDFDNDGRDDLVIGAPGEAIGAENGAGAINILYGSPSGLTHVDNQVIHQDSSGVEGGSEAGDGFGASLAVGDFNDDGRDDIVVGIPGEGVSAATAAGAIQVFPGSASGIDAGSDTLLFQGDTGVAGSSETNDAFGTSVAAGNFDGDDYDDIVVGIPGEDVGAINAAGAIHVFFGASGGISTSGDFQLDQDSTDVAGAAEAGDSFGFSVASGDFDDDGFEDIVVGTPGEGVGAAASAGVISIFFGSASGPSVSDDYYLSQDSTGVGGTAEAGDGFGFSLTVGDFDNDGMADIGVGIPGEEVNSAAGAGAIQVFLGTATGPNGDEDTLLHQDSSGISGGAEANDGFGFSVAAGDFDGDGRDDIGIGVVDEGLGAASGAGAVHLLFGSASGITTSGDLLFNE